jgi:hypothetical protein
MGQPSANALPGEPSSQPDTDRDIVARGAFMSTTATTDPETATAEVAFYRHTRKPKWGIGLIVWERDGKRGYKFEDGQLRIIAEPYYKLMEPAENPPPDSPLMAELQKLRSADGSGDDANRMTFEEQRGVFVEQFPDGFVGEEWRKAYRGRREGRRLKRHREGAIAEAQELLSAQSLDEIVAGHKWKELQDGLASILGSTDLVSRANLEPFRRSVAGEPFVLALRDALWGQGDFDARFAELCQQMSMLWSRVPWTMATALLALVHPKDHICVKPSVFVKQADCSPVTVRPSKQPTPRAYAAYLELARQLRNNLSDVGLPPHDLWDIHDFIWVTQRPAATDVLAKVRAQSEAQPQQPAIGAEPEEPEAPPTAVAKPSESEAADGDEDEDEDEDDAAQDYGSDDDEMAGG